jgi:hypothetical protein
MTFCLLLYPMKSRGKGLGPAPHYKLRIGTMSGTDKSTFNNFVTDSRKLILILSLCQQLLFSAPATQTVSSELLDKSVAEIPESPTPFPSVTRILWGFDENDGGFPKQNPPGGCPPWLSGSWPPLLGFCLGNCVENSPQVTVKCVLGFTRISILSDNRLFLWRLPVPTVRAVFQPVLPRELSEQCQMRVGHQGPKQLPCGCHLQRRAVSLWVESRVYWGPQRDLEKVCVMLRNSGKIFVQVMF